MNYWWCSISVGVMILSGCGGSPPPATSAPSVQSEAQSAYSRTKWCFAHQLAFSKLVREAGAPSVEDNKTQAFFQMTSGTRVIYTELLPGSGIRAFYGLGRLEPLPELVAPIYRLYSPGIADRPDVIMVVGFCGSRMFRIQAEGTNRLTALRDAVSLATNALTNLRQQAIHP